MDTGDFLMKRPLMMVLPLVLASILATNVVTASLPAFAQTNPVPRLTRSATGARLATNKSGEAQEEEGSNARKKKALPVKRAAPATAAPTGTATGQGTGNGAPDGARPSGRTRPSGSQDGTAAPTPPQSADTNARPNAGAQPSGRTRPTSGTDSARAPLGGAPQSNARPSGRTRPGGSLGGQTPGAAVPSRASAPQGNARPSGRTRPSGQQVPATGRSRTIVRAPVTTGNVRPPPRSNVHKTHNTTEVHNYYDTPAPGCKRASATPARAQAAPEDDLYLSVGLGMHGLQQPQISETALMGPQLSVALGKKGRLLATELAVHGSRWNPEGSEVGAATITMLGASADLKLQPSLGSIEPSIMAGVGAFGVEDLQLKQNALAGAFRLGVGLDMRIWEIALGARYTYSYLAFMGESHTYDQVSAQSESFGLNLSIFF